MIANIHVDMNGRGFSDNTAEQLALMLEEMARNVRNNASVIDRQFGARRTSRDEVVHSCKFQSQADLYGGFGDGISGEIKIINEGK